MCHCYRHLQIAVQIMFRSIAQLHDSHPLSSICSFVFYIWQDLVCKTFFEFWFEEPASAQTQFAGDGSSVPLEVAKKTEQVVEMLRRMPSHQLLVTVIRRNLTLDFLPQMAKAVGLNAASLASVRRRCELMCRCLLERILQVYHVSFLLLDKVSGCQFLNCWWSAFQVEETTDEVEVRALPYVLALHAFCVVDPTLCAPASDPYQFVVTLQPYLKSQVSSNLYKFSIGCVTIEEFWKKKPSL